MDFVKKEWQFRDVISENELNRMEDGIEEGITKAEQAQQTATDAQTNLDNHVSATTGVHGATSAATPNTIVQRDGNGRFKAAAPSASDDVARKAEVDDAINYALPKTARSTRIIGPATLSDLDLSNVDIVFIETSNGDVTINNVLTNISGHRCRLVKINTPGTITYKAGGPGNWVQGGIDIVLGSEDRYAFIDLVWSDTGNNVYVNAVADNGQKYARIDSEGNVLTKTRVYFSNDDYIEFDDSSDTYSFKDDGTASGGPQDSNIKAARIRLTATDDVSETSTLHAFQIGPDSGENIRVDTNEIIFANNGVFAQGYINGARVDLANSLRGHDGGNAQAKLGSTWYDIWHAGNFPYETGTWTPELRFGGQNTGISYASRRGQYTRIANVVHWTFEISLSSKGSASGIATIAGLPFSKGVGFDPHAVGNASNISVPSGQWLSSYIASTSVYLTTNNGVLITSAEFANNSLLRASGFYFI